MPVTDASPPDRPGDSDTTPSSAGRPWSPGRRAWWRAGVAGLFLAAVLFVGLWCYPDQSGPARTQVATVDIPPGAGLLGIRKILVRARIVSPDPRFILFAKLMGTAKRLKAGEYAFAPGMSPRAVLMQLAAGRTVRHAITIPEGSNLYQVADILQAGAWGGREDVLRLATDPGFIRGLGLSAASLEGYLFPDTYFFEKGAGLKAIIASMVRHMRQVLAAEKTAARGQPSLGSGPTAVVDGMPALTDYQLLTLASIVEKETALASERPLVAKVFLNRLRSGMKLQADPTVIYGALKFGTPLTKVDLETPTPYNTYTNLGLPVGPICSPGRASIEAVLRPSSEDFYYFVSQNDGTHYFSRNLSEHNRAVSRYRERVGGHGAGASR